MTRSPPSSSGSSGARWAERRRRPQQDACRRRGHRQACRHTWRWCRAPVRTSQVRAGDGKHDDEHGEDHEHDDEHRPGAPARRGGRAVAGSPERGEAVRARPCRGAAVRPAVKDGELGDQVAQLLDRGRLGRRTEPALLLDGVEQAAIEGPVEQHAEALAVVVGDGPLGRHGRTGAPRCRRRRRHPAVSCSPGPWTRQPWTRQLGHRQLGHRQRRAAGGRARRPCGRLPSRDRCRSHRGILDAWQPARNDRVDATPARTRPPERCPAVTSPGQTPERCPAGQELGSDREGRRHPRVRPR